MKHSLFDRIAIIGLGLIGGSIARAVRKSHVADIIVGCDINSESLHVARAQKIIDMATTDPKIAVAECQLVIIAAPLSALEPIAKRMAPGLAKEVLVMDTASVKQYVMHAVAPHLPNDVRFVPSHPIAGSEQSGIAASRDNLFAKKRVIITPGEPLESTVLQKINGFWSALGARVDAMPPDIHDHVYAHVSHLPQLLAFACRRLGIGTHDPELTAFTRLQSSNPALWSEIWALNANYMLPALDRYVDATAHIAHELKQAPESADQPQNIPASTARLFARVAASCLITTVMEAEKNAGVPFARYAGSGMADFTSPAMQPPEADIENISHQSAAVAALLDRYIALLGDWRSSIANQDAQSLQTLVSQPSAAA